jgi:nicotinate dehydrogenase subunit B
VTLPALRVRERQAPDCLDLAILAGVDPVEFRLKHLGDPRGQAVIKLAAKRFGWMERMPIDHGKGFAFARYKNLAAYLALALEGDRARDRTHAGHPRHRSDR